MKNEYIHLRLPPQARFTNEDELLSQNLWDALALLRYLDQMVNLLEGRISPEIFVRHYWSPNMKQDIERVRKVIDSLADQLM